jgi:hypothetical protein
MMLAIQKGPTAFDTSPEALIQLKKSGVPDDCRPTGRNRDNVVSLCEQPIDLHFSKLFNCRWTRFSCLLSAANWTNVKSASRTDLALPESVLTHSRIPIISSSVKGVRSPSIRFSTDCWSLNIIGRELFYHTMWRYRLPIFEPAEHCRAWSKRVSGFQEGRKFYKLLTIPHNLFGAPRVLGHYAANKAVADMNTRSM